MMALPAPLETTLGALTLLAGVCDLRWQRIPDVLTVGGVVLGFVLHSLASGPEGLVTAATGLVVALASLLPLYALRLARVHEVKLMAAVGTLAGTRMFLWILVATAILTGVYALVMLVRGRRFRRTIGDLVMWVREAVSLKPPYRGKPEADSAVSAGNPVPPAVIVLLATVVVLVGRAWTGS